MFGAIKYALQHLPALTGAGALALIIYSFLDTFVKENAKFTIELKPRHISVKKFVGPGVFLGIGLPSFWAMARYPRNT